VRIAEIDVESVSVLEAKRDSPVSADGHGPEAFQVAFERVQAIAGNVQRLGRFGDIEGRENTLNLRATPR
jgi:hypothetical protein